jgi:site-specific DNA recombinase
VRKIAGIMTAIEDGMYTSALKERMEALEKRKLEIEALLAEAGTPTVIRLHPNAAEVYRRKVAELELALNDDAIKAEAGEIIRSLIDRIVLTPSAGAPDGLDARLHGDLAAVLALSDPDKQKLPVLWDRGVNCRWLRGHATTYTEPSFGGRKGAKPPTVDSAAGRR